MFWEDSRQADERLTGTYVMYGDKPVMIDRVSNDSAVIVPADGSPSKTVRLDDPLFYDFHKLPPLGYVNVVGTGTPLAVLLTRVPERSRSHGLKSGRVTIEELLQAGMMKSPRFNLNGVLSDKGYSHRIAGIYPKVSEILDKLPEGCSVAFSPKYAVCLDGFGLFRLFRRNRQIGLVTPNGLRLSESTACFREDLQAEPSFDINAIEVS